MGNSKRKGVIIVVAVIIVAVAGILIYLSGTRLNGTYSSGGLINQTFTFDGDNITMSAFGVNATGTYKIEGDYIVITYSLFGQSYTWKQTFSKSWKKVTIGGTTFTKQ